MLHLAPRIRDIFQLNDRISVNRIESEKKKRISIHVNATRTCYIIYDS